MDDHMVNCAKFYNAKTGTKIDQKYLALGGFLDAFCGSLLGKNRDKKCIVCWWTTLLYTTKIVMENGSKLAGFARCLDPFCGALSGQNRDKLGVFMVELCGRLCDR